MAGRKRFDIDWKKVGQLLEAGCSGAEVAASMGMDRNTLYKAFKRDHKIDFSAYLQEKRSSGNTILRAAQFKTAIGGNVSMQIWLGKNRLDQTDKNETRLSGGLENTITDVRFELPKNGTESGGENPLPPNWTPTTGGQ